MSRALRNRKNRKDTSEQWTEPLYGAMVAVTAYRGTVRMVEVHSAAPGSARMAGKYHEDLLPSPRGESA